MPLIRGTTSKVLVSGTMLALAITGCASNTVTKSDEIFDPATSSSNQGQPSQNNSTQDNSAQGDSSDGRLARKRPKPNAKFKPGATVSALTVLHTLNNGPRTVAGYERSYFPHWIWIGSCNTRGLVLKRDSEVPTTSRGICTVETGRWRSYYDGLVLTQASQVDIDHMVPLAEAWRSGANGWTTATRESYANDLGFRWSLIPVSAASNRSKSDGDPASWIPKKTYQCRYAKNWVAVKYRWSLSVDQSERNALTRLIQDCADPSITVPKQATIQYSTIKPGAATNGAKRQQQNLQRESSVYYRTCAEAKRAGAAPLHRGEPGYSRHLDRDNDGVACEG